MDCNKYLTDLRLIENNIKYFMSFSHPMMISYGIHKLIRLSYQVCFHSFLIIKLNHF